MTERHNRGGPQLAAKLDGTQSDLDRDLGVYLELARGYQRRKKFPRPVPRAA